LATRFESTQEPKKDKELDWNDFLICSTNYPRFTDNFVDETLAEISYGKALSVQWKLQNPFLYSTPTSECSLCEYRVAKTFPQNSTYLGQWKGEKRHGRGTQLTFDNAGAAVSVYEGYWSDDLRNGQGRSVTKEGDSYLGRWKKGTVFGEGKKVWVNGDSYKGTFVDGKCNGFGVKTWADGSSYSGHWQNN